MKMLFAVLAAFFALAAGATSQRPDLPPRIQDDVVDTGPCNLTCWCTGDECFWMPIEKLCSSAAFCEAQQEEHDCSVQTAKSTIDGRCLELKPTPPRPKF